MEIETGIIQNLNNGNVTLIDQYPKPTTDGFAYKDAGDEAMKLESKEYENGNEVIRITLKRGRIALVRELKGSELEKVTKIAISSGGDAKDDETYMPALIHVCATIDGKPIIMEDVNELRAKDYSVLKLAAGRLNFM